MSRIGKMPIVIPAKVQVSITGQAVKVTGPRGNLAWSVPEGIRASVADGKVTFTPESSQRRLGALHGLSRAMVNNMVIGVSQGFTKDLELQGVGYRAKVDGKKLVLNVGFSHPVEMVIPEGLSLEVSKKQDNISITGSDKQVLGEFAAVVRRVRPPEPYKGKGIRYRGEIVKTKAGKKVSA